ncbi:hypothetical protein ABKN59_008437 [Abortiporus biennis]
MHRLPTAHLRDLSEHFQSSPPAMHPRAFSVHDESIEDLAQFSFGTGALELDIPEEKELFRSAMDSDKDCS